MRSRLARLAFMLTVGLRFLAPADLLAQGTVLGTFRWQLRPYCNVLTVTVVQLGEQYHIDGTDDGCGAARKASVVGLAFPNPDGSIGFGLTTVTTPGGTPLHVDATIAIASLSGTWRDSGGNSGSFVFTPGSATAGGLRPIPAGGIPPGTITGAQIAPGTITAAQLAPGAITTAGIAGAAAGFGTCPVGAYLRGIQPNGTVLCEPIGTPPTISTIDSAGNVGRDTSLAIGLDGRPVISYSDRTGVDRVRLKVAVCTTAACTGTPIVTTVDDSVPSVGAFSSVAIGADGHPVISYYDGTNVDLKVAVCANPACTGTPTITTVDSVGDVGAYSSIAIGTDGHPVISYYDSTNHALKVAVCANSTCTGTPTITAVDSVGLVSNESTALAIGPDGRPVIGYSVGTPDNDLKVAVCANAACTGAATITIVDSVGSVGAFPSLAIGVDGRPVISYWDAGNDDLKVAVCANPACTGTPAITTVDGVGLVGQHSSVAIGTDGRPVISYYDATPNNDLKVAACANSTCTGTPTITIVDSGGIVGEWSSLAIGAEGRPVISYHDGTNSDLKVAKCNSRTCGS